MSSAETDVSELGGLPGAPPPPLGPPLEVPKMGPGDVVLLEMNGEKWAFVNLKRGQCVPARSPRPHSSTRTARAERVASPPPPPAKRNDSRSNSTDAPFFSTRFVFPLPPLP